MRRSLKSAVRSVKVTHDGLPLHTTVMLAVAHETLTRSKAGISELSVEQNAKRYFGESNDAFAERMLDTRSYVRNVTEQNESRY